VINLFYGLVFPQYRSVSICLRSLDRKRLSGVAIAPAKDVVATSYVD